MANEPTIDGPRLIHWAIVRVEPIKYPGKPHYYFTGIGFDHPLLLDGVQILTTAIEEISEDCTWGRTQSRIYKLYDYVAREHFTEEMMVSARAIIEQEFLLEFSVDYTSIEEWRQLSLGFHSGNSAPI